jgi:hypothetical protein
MRRRVVREKPVCGERYRVCFELIGHRADGKREGFYLHLEMPFMPQVGNLIQVSEKDEERPVLRVAWNARLGILVELGPVEGERCSVAELELRGWMSLGRF